MEKEQTLRGFGIYNFEDANRERCSIQKSSSAMEDMIWIGISEPDLTVFEKNKGIYVVTPMPECFMVSSRMHLTQDMVKQLLPVLTRFAETGEI